MKRTFGFIVFLAIAGVVASRMDYFGPKVEVSNFSCERTSVTDFQVKGTVKNISDKPLTLTATVALLSTGFPQKFSGPVKPQSLAPGATARFTIRDRLPGNTMFRDADCRLDNFRDEAGKSVKYTLAGAAAANR